MTEEDIKKWQEHILGVLQSLLTTVESMQKQIDKIVDDVSDNQGLMTCKEVMSTLHISRTTLYRMMMLENKITPVPLYDKNGRKKKTLRFKRSQIMRLQKATE